MAEFPPNLDDGEMWIPSDIFPDEAIPSKHSPNDYPPPQLNYRDDYAQLLATYTLLRYQNSKPPINLAPNLQRFRATVEYGNAVPVQRGYAGVNGGQSIYHFGTRASYTGSGPVYQPHLFRPAHAQVESFIGKGGMVLQKEQNNQQKRFLQNGGSASIKGGFVRECGGTGVFLPRVAAPATPSSGHARKHTGVTRRQETEPTAARNFMSSNGARKQEEFLCQLPSEMGLPQEWTY